MDSRKSKRRVQWSVDLVEHPPLTVAVASMPPWIKPNSLQDIHGTSLIVMRKKKHVLIVDLYLNNLWRSYGLAGFVSPKKKGKKKEVITFSKLKGGKLMVTNKLHNLSSESG